VKPKVYAKGSRWACDYDGAVWLFSNWSGAFNCALVLASGQAPWSFPHHIGMVKDPAAMELGAKGGRERARNLTKAERSESARRAVTIRWERERMKAQKDGEL
jgi:hypothetical protein